MLIKLESGTLELQIEQTQLPLEELLDFAIRRNPKRGFLFVSKVLGKHIPISPSVAEQTYQALVAQLPPLTKPHFIGLAETATALGEGVFQSWRTQTGQEGTFQHTTRYITGQPVLFRFDEPHSHAPAHIVYDPGHLARSAEELVLVDDEISTGTTLQNLAEAWLTQHPNIKKIVLVSLADWCPRRKEVQEALDVPVEFISLLRGQYRFEAAPNWKPPQLPPVIGNGGDKSEILPTQAARFGQPFSPVQLEDLGLDFKAQDRVLVLGTGEFQYPAFALAQQIEPLVKQCRWNATTRSPILPGTAIQHILEFKDNVQDNIPNYLYNVQPEDFDHIVLTYEGQCIPDPALLAQLGPHAMAVKLV